MKKAKIEIARMSNVGEPTPAPQTDFAKPMLLSLGLTEDEIGKIEKGEAKADDVVASLKTRFETAATERVKSAVEQTVKGEMNKRAFMVAEEKVIAAAKEMGIDPELILKDAPDKERLERLAKSVVESHKTAIAAMEAKMATLDKGAELTQVEKLLKTSNAELEKSKKEFEAVKLTFEKEKQAIRDEVDFERIFDAEFEKIADKMIGAADKSTKKKTFKMLFDATVNDEGMLDYVRDANGRISAAVPKRKDGAGIEIAGKLDNHTLSTFAEYVLFKSGFLQQNNLPQTGGLPRSIGNQTLRPISDVEIENKAKERGLSFEYVKANAGVFFQ
jgi:hypothetical protein